tara:strand:+ start:429 stop:536 length:108 start_codon:yes stop_codon:yes gene_type:complete
MLAEYIEWLLRTFLQILQMAKFDGACADGKAMLRI